MKNTKAVLGVLVIFVLGAIVGTLITRMFYEKRIEALVSGNSQAREEALINMMSRRLNLDEGQRDQVRVIIHNTRQAIHQQIQPLTLAAREKSQIEIRKILRPEQITSFEKMLAEKKDS
ncbi:MAG: hypothetical protein CSYNP_01813 [Syntrophus sp. SKADARSKE-3]|nr:hypothetical protein [Syntrophus sp. SKADARSKE-3]